jgi:hypothetical protein
MGDWAVRVGRRLCVRVLPVPPVVGQVGDRDLRQAALHVERLVRRQVDGALPVAVLTRDDDLLEHRATPEALVADGPRFGSTGVRLPSL